MADLSHEAAQRNLIDMSVGVPYFPTLPGVDESAEQRHGHEICGYSGAEGVPGLGDAILKLYEVDPPALGTSDTVVTCGATEAIAISILTLTSAGDDVGYFAPSYPGYPDQIRLLGRNPIAVPAPPLVDEAWVDSVLRPRRLPLFIVNSPANPTGRVFRSSELHALLAGIEPEGVIVIDEVYSPFVRSGSLVPNLDLANEQQDRIVRVHSASKLFGRPGWRVGWAVAHRRLVDPLRALHAAVAVCAPTPMQFNVLAALAAGPTASLERARAHQMRVQAFIDRLRDRGWDVQEPEAGFYIRLMSHRFDTSSELHGWLRDRCGVQSVPWTFFLPDEPVDWPPSVRLSIVGDDATLDRALMQITDPPS